MPSLDEGNSALVEKFYQAALCPDLWQDTLTGFAEATCCRGALLPTSTFVPGRLLHSRGMGDVLDQFFSQGWHERDLRTIVARDKRKISGFFADQDLFSADQMRRSEYYNGFARDAGVPWFAAALLTDRFEEGYVAVSLQRSDKEGPFQPRELDRLDALLPHLRNAVQFATKLAGKTAEAMLDGLTAARQAALLLDHKGRVVRFNNLCLAFMGAGLTIRHGRMRADSADQDAKLAELIRWACEDSASLQGVPETSGIAVSTLADGGAVVVKASPIRQVAGDIFGFHGAILFVTPMWPRVTVSEPMLGSLFDLTRREAQVMAMIGSGQTVEAIANQLKISREAVRFHMKGVFAKTGGHRQSEIVALCNRLALTGMGARSEVELP
jgi:DNA-binding CsgD family transcriptional regulator